jgi:hypothetical protein
MVPKIARLSSMHASGVGVSASLYGQNYNPFQSILQSIEASSCAYLQGFGRSLAAAQVVEGTE